MNNLAQIRLQKGISQTGLAKKVGLSPKTISAYETGNRKGPVDKWRLIAKALGVKLQELFTDTL